MRREVSLRKVCGIKYKMKFKVISVSLKMVMFNLYSK